MLWLPVWLLLALIVVSLGEYAGHRWPLHHGLWVRHLPFGRDHLDHHKRFTTAFEWAAETPSYYDPLWVRFLFGLLWSAPLAALAFVCGFWWLGGAMLGVAAVHATVWQWVHNQMHRPTCAWLTGTAYFRRIRDHHKLHHEKLRTNFGFLFAPAWDRVFGTRHR